MKGGNPAAAARSQIFFRAFKQLVLAPSPDRSFQLAMPQAVLSGGLATHKQAYAFCAKRCSLTSFSLWASSELEPPQQETIAIAKNIHHYKDI
ncbi:MAG: hypothetical protein M0Z83_10370 [Betaproteobacteria bacterium]|nr:hypothetical protein [Betaproteobacteria bacterium]